MSAATDVLSEMTVIQLERRRQIEEEGWTTEHDDEHVDGELVRAAAVYALAYTNLGKDRVHVIPEMTFWPHGWDDSWFKPTYDDPVRMLVKAGALIAAEIGRLQRQYAREHGTAT